MFADYLRLVAFWSVLETHSWVAGAAKVVQ